MTDTYSLSAHAIDESLKDAVCCLLDDEPLPIDLDLETYELDELLSERHRIAIVCDALDVCDLRPDLNLDQAWEVLKAANEPHDAEIGIRWSVLRHYADDLYGPAPTDAMGGRL
jgi:hypothetical protein